MLCDAINRGREDDIRSSESPFVGTDYTQIDVAMEGGGRDGPDLFDVEVVVNSVGRIFTPWVVREETCTRLTEKLDEKNNSSSIFRLTVWIRIGKSPSLLCLLLRPLRMASMRGTSSASACPRDG